MNQGRWSDELVFSCDVETLPTGGCYGNLEAFARADAVSDLDGLYCPLDDQWYCGQVRFRFFAAGERLMPLATRFFPSYQETIYGTEGIVLSKRIFVPYRVGYQQSVCWQMDLETEGHQYIQIEVDIRWPAIRSYGHTRQPPSSEQEKRVRQEMESGLLVARTVGREREVRVFGSNGPPSQVQFIEPGRARLSYFVLAEGYVDVPFILTFSPAGEQLAWNGFLANGEAGLLLQESSQRMEEAIGQSRLITPDPVINRGLAWAAINTLRVQQRYRLGAGFTNDPPGDVVVVRDAAWYGMGADYLTPDFVADLYRLIQRYGIYEGGKLAEYIRAVAGTHEDYGLSLNDDTPLFIIAVHHHYALHRDRNLLHDLYPAVRDAAHWIIQQIEGGLVWARAEGTNVYGITSWRNIIPGYRLDGAVTEINAECAWALRCAADLAAAIGDAASQARFASEAQALTEAIRERLLSPETGLYLLALDDEGLPRPELTVDQVFPLLAGIAPADVRSRIIERLWSPAWMSPYGLRTVGEDEPTYDPRFGFGLLGGIWPNAWAWAALAHRADPDRLVDALHRLCLLCAPPAEGKSDRVPGQFPEWLDGETGENRGMMLSPWFPPTLLWLAMEGLAGLQPQPDELCVTPSVPRGWRWFVCQRVPRGPRFLTFFYLDGVLHSNRPIASPLPVQVYDRIERAHQEERALVLQRGEQRWVFAFAPGEGWEGRVRVENRWVSVSLAAGEARLIPVKG
ncbi:MAG: hypothetical protein RML36_11940 [Anaerolineae bacterium]|nr:hypothetical protein [Anaerolineae bacterium]MDW8100180.1 hypothetical protein [Anaerolineae bacterium]